MIHADQTVGGYKSILLRSFRLSPESNNVKWMWPPNHLRHCDIIRAAFYWFCLSSTRRMNVAVRFLHVLFVLVCSCVCTCALRCVDSVDAFSRQTQKVGGIFLWVIFSLYCLRVNVNAFCVQMTLDSIHIQTHTHIHNAYEMCVMLMSKSTFRPAPMGSDIHRACKGHPRDMALTRKPMLRTQNVNTQLEKPTTCKQTYIQTRRWCSFVCNITQHTVY